MKQEQALTTAKPGYKAIIVSGLIVGTLDILAAIVDYYVSTGKGPAGIFKYIASAVRGNDAFAGGTNIIIAGLIFHYVIAFSFTIFFFFLYQKSKWMASNRLIAGILYGIFIWTIMNRVVVPLSLAPQGPFVLWKAIKAALILICMIGLPLSFLADKFMKRTSS